MKTLVKNVKGIGVLTLILILSVFNLYAQESTLPQEVIDKMEKVVDSKAEYMQDIYKDLHANPELGFMEVRTSGIIAKELKQLGFEVHTSIGVTGVVGILRNGEGPTLMFRGDMDALSVKEETGLPYASTKCSVNHDGDEVPVGHMCGHDAHSTWVISMAHTMSAMKDYWSGTLVVVGQPAEEIVKGAQAMVDDGLFTKYNVPKPDYFLAQHTAPLPTGTLVTTDGRLTTGTTHLDIIFHGIGGHGSSPHHAIDPVVMAGMAIVQLQTVVSRITDPEEVAVLTIGSVQVGIEHNVIPTEAHLKLKLHFSDDDTMNKMLTSIRNIVNGIANSYSVPEDMMPEITQSGFGPAIFNDTEFVNQIRSASDRTDFVKLRVDNETMPGSEDAFALIHGLDDVKGVYLFIGTAEPEIFEKAKAEGKEYPFTPHEPNYTVDLNGITFGSKVSALAVLEIMQNKK